MVINQGVRRSMRSWEFLRLATGRADRRRREGLEAADRDRCPVRCFLDLESNTVTSPSL